MTEKTTPSCVARHTEIRIQSMPEIQREAVYRTNRVYEELSTNRPADYTFLVHYKFVLKNRNC